MGGPRNASCIFIVQKMCPNVILVIRDNAHAVRIAMRDPRHFDGVFGHVQKRLFVQKHAVVPDLQNSHKLKDMLTAAQGACLRIPGRDRPLDSVLRHFSWAKQRFDSVCDPLAKAACMLLPICTALSMASVDVRVKPEKRQRAADALKLFTPKLWVSRGALAGVGL